MDQRLVDEGFAPTREKAQALILAGLVLVDGRVFDKPGAKVKEGSKVEVVEPFRYVSRGGYKLENAIERLGLCLDGFVALDVGSSTGGFTDCLLQKGVKKVYAVDVGRAQMDQKLRRDSRVVLYEETDAREITEKHIPEKVDIITMDVSFISSTKLLSSVVNFLKDDGLLLVLVKPQFEVHPRYVKRGIVRDEDKKVEAILRVVELLRHLDYPPSRIIKAQPKGSKGNEEFFILAKKGKEVLEDAQWEAWRAVKEHV